jgi:hypothetical protein
MAELKVKISADTSGFTQGMNFTKKDVQAWSRVMQQESEKSKKVVESNMLAAFAGITAAAAAAGVSIKESLDFGQQMRGMGDRTGISTEFLQGVGLEAAKSGSSVEEVVNFMEKLVANSQRALGGNKELQQTFERMGLTMQDLENDSIEQIFNKVREHMRDTKLDAESLADLLRVGDEGAGKLVPMLRGEDSPEWIRNSDETITKLGVLKDEFSELWAIIKAGIRDVVEFYLFPAMDFLTMGRLSKQLKDRQKNQGDEQAIKVSSRAEDAQKKKEEEEKKKAQKEEEKHAEKIAKLQADVQKSVREYQFSRLKTDEERIAFLEKEKAAMVDVMNNLDPENEESRLKAQADVNRTQKEIDQLKDKETDRMLDELGLGVADKAFKPPKGAPDSLVSVGNFLGSDPNAKMERELKESKDLLREIRNNTKPAMSGGDYPQ